MKKRIFSIVVVGLIVLDQLFKYLISLKLPDQFDSITIIDGILNFTHIDNTGAAFGILNEKQYILIPIVLILIIGFIYLTFTNKLHGILTQTAVSMIVSGGIGNLIDRIFRNGCVFDYIDLTFKPFQGFAVFNFADCLVVIGTILLLISILKDDFFTSKSKTEVEYEISEPQDKEAKLDKE